METVRRARVRPHRGATASALVLAGLLAACSSPATDDDAEPAASGDSDAASETEAETETESEPESEPTTAATTTPTTTASSDEPDTVADGSSTSVDESPAGPATLDPITVAVLYPDVSIAADFGFAEPLGDFVPAFEAFMQDANERGGFGGHVIELEMVEFDLIVDGDSVRACLTATQDLGADIVLGAGGVFGDPVVCVTEQNETVLVNTDGSPDEIYERADGRLFSITPSKEATQTAILTAFGDVLAAAPFAVFSSFDTGGDSDAVQSHFLPALADAGLDPAVTIVLDGDAAVAASQIPIEIERLRSAGVETIVSTAGFFSTSPFATALESAGLELTWVGSDAAGFASNLYAANIDPGQLDGARGITVTELGWSEAGLDEPAQRLECRRRGEELLDTTIDVDSIDMTSIETACNYADLLVAAGAFLDGAPTTETIVGALESVEQIEFAGYGDVGFGVGDRTGAQTARRVTWSADCACWTAIGEFEPVYVD